MQTTLNFIKDDNKKYKFTFIDLFAGIWGFRIALEKLWGKCVWYSEIDKTALSVYRNNFKTDDEIFIWDIKKPTSFIYADIITGWVPCQSWSVAGSKNWFNDPRWELWFDTIQFVNHSKPKGFIFENVKWLADPRNKKNLDLIIKSFEDIGYKIYYQVLNSFDYWLPQNRERIFLVGIQKSNIKTFQFPNKHPFFLTLANLFNNKNLRKIKTTSDKNINNSFNMSYKLNKGNFFTFCDTRNGENTIHSWDIIETNDIEKEICMAILKNRRKKIYGPKDGNPLTLENIIDLVPKTTKKNINNLIDKKILIKKEGKIDLANSKNLSWINWIYRIYTPDSYVFSTLTKTWINDYITEISIPENEPNKKQYFLDNIFLPKKFRKISIKEWAKIQGFPDNYIFLEDYKKSMWLLGNSLWVNIVHDIMKELLKTI